MGGSSSKAKEARRHTTRGFTCLLNLLKNILELITAESRDNGRRRFVSAKTVVIPCVGYRCSQQILVLSYSL
mgnify:CR=1 FL=1